MSVGVLVFMGGMWGFLGAFCVPWDDPTCPGHTQDYQIQKWEGPRTFCPCPHFTEWRPRGSSRLPGHRALACGRAEARSQDPSHHISLHSHLPKTQPVPWPPGESGPLARPPAQMNLLQPRGLQPQGGPSLAHSSNYSDQAGTSLSQRQKDDLLCQEETLPRNYL